jgi:uncharacterized protein YsxB (DUF464 family)
MIKVKVRGRHGECEIYVSGHAGKDNKEICTAVSTVMASAELFLKQLSLQYPDIIEFEDKTDIQDSAKAKKSLLDNAKELVNNIVEEESWAYIEFNDGELGIVVDTITNTPTTVAYGGNLYNLIPCTDEETKKIMEG